MRSVKKEIIWETGVFGRHSPLKQPFRDTLRFMWSLGPMHREAYQGASRPVADMGRLEWNW